MEMQNPMETNNTKKFTEMFSELEHCTEEDQKQKIEEMNEVIDEMYGIEIHWTFTKDLFNKMNEMIEERKIPMENVIILLKHLGYRAVLIGYMFGHHCFSSLSERLKKMIIEEDEKKEEKNEKLLVSLCECHLLLDNALPSKLTSICMSCLQKVASKKEENEDVQKEVEMALFALNKIYSSNGNEKDLILKIITEIIKYHQEHHNLTQLAYQSAWMFLINRLHQDESLEEVIVNELHFIREEERELEDLSKCVNWKKKEEERANEKKEVFIIRRWIRTFKTFLFCCRLQNEKFLVIIESIVQAYRAAKDNYGEIGKECVCSLGDAVRNGAVKIDDLLKGGAVDSVLKEIQQTTNENLTACICLEFYLKISERLKGNSDDEMEEEKRKEMKRKMQEVIEEEGYEDTITSFYEKFDFLSRHYCDRLSLNISDYFVFV